MTTINEAPETDVYYDPYDTGINNDPYPTFARLREDAPVYYNEQYDFWAISRHSDVEQALANWQVFSSRRSDILELVKSKFDMPGGVHTSGLQGSANAGVGGIPAFDHDVVELVAEELVDDAFVLGVDFEEVGECADVAECVALRAVGALGVYAEDVADSVGGVAVFADQCFQRPSTT